MTLPEVKKHFKELTIDKDPYYGNLPPKFSTTEFINDLLGMAPALESDTEANRNSSPVPMEGENK